MPTGLSCLTAEALSKLATIMNSWRVRGIITGFIRRKYAMWIQRTICAGRALNQRQKVAGNDGESALTLLPEPQCLWKTGIYRNERRGARGCGSSTGISHYRSRPGYLAS